MLNRLAEKVSFSPSDIVNRGAEFGQRARTRVLRARSEGSETLWTFRVDTLTKVEDFLSNAPDLPVLGQVADAAERLVHGRIEATTAVPVQGYDDLNTRKVGEAIQDMGRVDLLKVRRYELANKNRKTVLGYIERELNRLEKSLSVAA